MNRERNSFDQRAGGSTVCPLIKSLITLTGDGRVEKLFNRGMEENSTPGQGHSEATILGKCEEDVQNWKRLLIDRGARGTRLEKRGPNDSFWGL